MALTVRTSVTVSLISALHSMEVVFVQVDGLGFVVIRVSELIEASYNNCGSFCFSDVIIDACRM